jgi:hypothetical protein
MQTESLDSYWDRHSSVDAAGWVAEAGGHHNLRDTVFVRREWFVAVAFHYAYYKPLESQRTNLVYRINLQ